MKARLLRKDGSITDNEYYTIEVYGKEFIHVNFSRGCITLQCPCSDYENTEDIEAILEEIIRRINEH